mgnify:CR=1 FL=1
MGRLNEAEAEIARQLEDIDNQLDVIAADLAAAMGTAEDVAGFLAGPAQRLDERLAEQQQRLEKLRDFADDYPAIQERLGNAIYHIGELRDLLKSWRTPASWSPGTRRFRPSWTRSARTCGRRLCASAKASTSGWRS